MRIRKWAVDNLSFGRKYLRAAQKQLEDVVLKESKQRASKQAYDSLWDKTLHCKESGVSSERLCSEEVVVSLTSYGNRIHEAHLAIESIMQQTVKPNRIVLWLAEDEFKGKTLPVALQMQQERGLEIAFCEDLKSYNKLIHSLNRFPEACVITVDDDSAYNYDVVEKLVISHNTHPSDICALTMRELVFGDDGKLLPYADWPHSAEGSPANNKLAFFLGVGGVLYPPHCFTEEVFNKEVFMSICGKQDDAWFNAMRLLDGVKVTKVFSSNPVGDLVPLPSTSYSPLMVKNVFGGGNDVAVSAVYGQYGLFDVLNNG